MSVSPEENGNLDSGLNQPPSNDELAEKLERVSGLLSAQGAIRFRAEAYHKAAEMIRALEMPVWQIYERDGIEGLDDLPGVGRTISRALQQLIRGGRWPLLKRLQGDDVAEKAFASVANIGPKLAQRIHDELQIETLAELQAAAWDGRLDRLPGLGEKRVRAVRETLASRGRNPGFGSDDVRIESAESAFDLTNEIPVYEILDIDDEYRFKAAKSELPRATPRRYNPTAEAWLPILHAERDDRHYTALFSNTEHAHAMGTTEDWVVIYLENHKKRGQHGRWTVITSQFGKLKGKRIVRGRENDCADYYKQRSAEYSG